MLMVIYARGKLRDAAVQPNLLVESMSGLWWTGWLGGVWFQVGGLSAKVVASGDHLSCG